MEKNIEILNEYLANLEMEILNLYNMHFNIVGTSFKETHTELGTLIEQMQKHYDSIAERIKMMSSYPVTNIKKVEELSQIKSMQSRNYTAKMVQEVLKNDFSYLRDYTKDLVFYFSKENDIYTSHMLLEIDLFLEKTLWFIESSLKEI